MKKNTLLLCAFFILTSLQAQKQMSQGWVVLNNGDTVKGLINYKQWNLNPEKIEFKSSGLFTYSVDDIKSFGAENENIYQRFTITRHALPFNDGDYIPDNEDSTITSTEWLRIIIKAKYSLAEFRTEERPFYFMIEADTAEELVFYKGIKAYTSDKYLNTSNYGKTFFLERPTFRDQLAAITEKPGAVKIPVPDNLRYSEYELSRFVSKMNGQSVVTKQRSQGSWGIAVGATYNLFNFSGNNGFNTFSGSVKNSISPLLSINYTVLSTRNLSRAGIMFDLAYTTINSTGDSKPFVDLAHEIHIKNSYLQLTAVPFYILTPYSPARLFIGGGLGFNSLLSSTESYISQKNLTSGLVTIQKGQPGGRSVVFGRLVAGVVAGRLNYYLSFSPMGDITTNVFASVKDSRLSAIIRIQIGK